jgi:MFS family permease
MSAGFLLASWGSQTWHFVLTQGLIYGVGSSMLYFPLISVAPEYFDRRRGAAMGFILSAAGVGGVVYSLLISVLLDKVGVGWTLRTMAAMNLVLALPIAWRRGCSSVGWCCGDPISSYVSMRRLLRDCDRRR